MAVVHYASCFVLFCNLGMGDDMMGVAALFGWGGWVAAVWEGAVQSVW